MTRTNHNNEIPEPPAPTDRRFRCTACGGEFDEMEVTCPAGQYHCGPCVPVIEPPVPTPSAGCASETWTCRACHKSGDAANRARAEKQHAIVSPGCNGLPEWSPVPPASAPAATPEPERCLNCGKVESEHIEVLGVLYCYRFTQMLQGEAAICSFSAPTGEEADDATNLAGLITMCRDLKARLVPFGASESGWDSAIATLERASAHATTLVTLRARVQELEGGVRDLDVIAGLAATELMHNDGRDARRAKTFLADLRVLADSYRAALAPRQPTENTK